MTTTKTNHADQNAANMYPLASALETNSTQHRI